jgi:hypothetical protein
MKVIMFQDRFAEMVRNGDKRQTIRPIRENPINQLDKISLRRWTGKPYRSKQEVLKESFCVFTTDISIDEKGAEVNGKRMPAWVLNGVADQDGFDGCQSMIEFFRKTYGLPFHGVLIQWN